MDEKKTDENKSMVFWFPTPLELSTNFKNSRDFHIYLSTRLLALVCILGFYSQ